MTIKDQLNKLKENWLLAAVLILLVVASGLFQQLPGSPMPYYAQEKMVYDSVGYGGVAQATRSVAPYYGQEDFAPDVAERKITRNTYLQLEVDRGDFKSSEERLKAIVSTTNSILMSENSYKSGNERYQTYSGTYTIKVESTKALAVISQLKDLGEVTSLSENAQDITGSYQNTRIELEAEKERLVRYQQMYREATTIQEKIDLNDRIFNQERTIKYLEDSLKNTDQQVEYVTLTVELHEKASSYASIALVTLSQLVRTFVDSINSVLQFVVFIIPYAILVLIGWLVVRLVRRRR